MGGRGMLTAGSETTAFGNTIGADFANTPAAESGSNFYPIMGENISIQAIVEGTLLAEIELDPIPEYGVHL